MSTAPNVEALVGAQLSATLLASRSVLALSRMNPADFSRMKSPDDDKIPLLSTAPVLSDVFQRYDINIEKDANVKKSVDFLAKKLKIAAEADQERNSLDVDLFQVVRDFADQRVRKGKTVGVPLSEAPHTILDVIKTKNNRGGAAKRARENDENKEMILIKRFIEEQRDRADGKRLSPGDIVEAGLKNTQLAAELLQLTFATTVEPHSRLSIDYTKERDLYMSFPRFQPAAT